MNIVLITLIWFCIDLYFFQSVQLITENKVVWWLYWIVDVCLLLAIYYMFLTYQSAGPKPKIFVWILGLMLMSVVPKLLTLPILIIDDLSRFIYYGYTVVRRWISVDSEIVLPNRRKFLSQLALGLASIPFTAFAYGILRGRYNYQVRRVTLTFSNLPKSFDRFTITQLSDIHVGSFDNKKEVQRGVQLANEQKSDMIVFTGDLVNNRAFEMDGWVDTFSTLSAPYGKYSIFGNHDYGDYVPWNSKEERDENLAQLVKIHKEMGFHLLRNENTTIRKGEDSIKLAGVENWGKGRFQKHGDVDKAMKGVMSDDFTMMLSHDPSHWEAQLLPFPHPIRLTLSGHTHGMQFGVEMGNFKWSPVQYMYPQWSGLYQQKDQYIYVNRGFGFIGYPGRVGILPEITVITLRCG